jgi:hypothetical protein
MNTSTILSVACAASLALIAGTAGATDAAKPTKTSAHAKALPKGANVTADSVETISATQLDIASRVLTGTAQCEFDQHVSVNPIEGRPGFFKVGYKNATYTMVPQETTTGAVRLEDKKAGVVWIQIPAKSMLLNGKIGQRMVDSCKQTEQRAAL